MSTDIQHLGREYSDGTVIGWECLVQLGHLAADAWQFLHQVDLDPHIGKIQGRLHTSNASPDNEYVFAHNQIL
jgi:hypothetical protein